MEDQKIVATWKQEAIEQGATPEIFEAVMERLRFIPKFEVETRPLRPLS